MMQQWKMVPRCHDDGHSHIMSSEHPWHYVISDGREQNLIPKHCVFIYESLRQQSNPAGFALHPARLPSHHHITALWPTQQIAAVIRFEALCESCYIYPDDLHDKEDACAVGCRVLTRSSTPDQNLNDSSSLILAHNSQQCSAHFADKFGSSV